MTIGKFLTKSDVNNGNLFFMEVCVSAEHLEPLLNNGYSLKSVEKQYL